MKMNTYIRSIFIIFLILLNIGCDQVSKSVVREKISYEAEINVIKHNLILTNVNNPGAMLGLGADLPLVWRKGLFISFPIMILILMIAFLFYKTKLKLPMVLGLTFIIGGGFGNIIDRMIYGSVTDFVHIDFEIFRTGIFNMADVSVMLGTIIIVFYNITEKEDIAPPLDGKLEGESSPTA